MRASRHARPFGLTQALAALPLAGALPARGQDEPHGFTGIKSKRWSERIEMERGPLPVNYFTVMTLINLGSPERKASLVRGTKSLFF